MSNLVPSPPLDATTTRRGLMSAADKVKIDAQSGTNTGDVTVSSPAGWLSLVGQALTFALVSAGAAVAGVVDTAAQTFAGVKTFLAEAVFSSGLVSTGVRAIGASLLLRSSLGSGASDRCVVEGTSETDAGTNAGAKLWIVATGIGGTPVDVAWFQKDGALRTTSGFVARGKSATNGFVYIGDDVGTRIAWGSQTITCGTGITLNSTGTFLSVYVGAGILRSFAADGAAAVALDVDTNSAWTNATARLQRWLTGGVVKSSIMSNGEFEHAVAGAGIVLKSPDGTRYRITVANGGTLSIAAA